MQPRARGRVEEDYQNLVQYMEGLPVVNTHSHHRPDAFFEDISLEKLLQESYAGWTDVRFDPEHREAGLALVRHRSYFVWLQRAMQRLYGFSEPITLENWAEVDRRLREAHADPRRHLALLQETCGFRASLQDAFWDPGSDNGHPEAFRPVYRVNMFLYGYAPEARDHNGNNAQAVLGQAARDIDAYVALMREAILARKAAGCVALKSAIAYDRGLDIEATRRDQAQRAFRQDRDARDIKAFQDYVFDKICEIAAEADLPFQNHTGLGLLHHTRAMCLHPMILRHPDTKFVLFHGSYPWCEDIAGLAHNYTNVYPDLVWLPLISPTAAQLLLRQLIEAGLSGRICWGCDASSGEESLGALLAARHALAGALAALCGEGYLEEGGARDILRDILWNNPVALYRLFK